MFGIAMKMSIRDSLKSLEKPPRFFSFLVFFPSTIRAKLRCFLPSSLTLRSCFSRRSSWMVKKIAWRRREVKSTFSSVPRRSYFSESLLRCLKTSVWIFALLFLSSFPWLQLHVCIALQHLHICYGWNGIEIVPHRHSTQSRNIMLS